MKFILEDKDKRLIDNINKDLEEGKDCILFVSQKNKEYTFKFECVDIAKAELFVSILMNSNYKDILEEVFGIKVLSFNYNGLESERERIKDILEGCINSLNDMARG